MSDYRSHILNDLNGVEDLFSSAPFIGIRRHRLLTDGDGVTTLAAFHGCPLSCKYCINPQCKSNDGIWMYLTPVQLYERVKIDDIYFQLCDMIRYADELCMDVYESNFYSKFATQTIKNPLAIGTSSGVTFNNVIRGGDINAGRISCNEYYRKALEYPAFTYSTRLVLANPHMQFNIIKD